ncbi:nucleolus protein [Mycena maculata]|uniref:25S rRNA adenine-N(1) methyltransferase n=1 Tax=Mycena maculata TaxID=230809 RepID=A0AAD7J4A4_9AGAR|nr:nucleolus protein [Mycena maculata]
MAKTRKKKVPITTTATASTSSSKPKSSRAVIRKFHILLKQQHQLESLPARNPQTAHTLDEIKNEIEQLGGLSAYQRMSNIGQGNDRGGGSERISIPWLKEIYKSPQGDGHQRPMLNLLEVGALRPDNYESCHSWIKTTPLDLHSRHPSILEQDFLLMDETEHCGKWDVLSLSLVLNFVPVAEDRGRMLRLAWEFLLPGGHLFLAFPLPCVMNSRYLTNERLAALMEAVGFRQVKERWKKGGKMFYALYEKSTQANTELFRKKTILREGANRNNFAILLY